MASPWVKVSVANGRVVVLWDPSGANREVAVESVLEAQIAVAGAWMGGARAQSPIGILLYDRPAPQIERARHRRPSPAVASQRAGANSSGSPDMADVDRGPASSREMTSPNRANDPPQDR